MTFEEMFGKAKFVKRGDGNGFSILRGRFSLKTEGKVMLRCVGLGFFVCYINGVRLSEDRYLPLATDYERRENYPPEEILTGHRLYVSEYDISEFVHCGDNVIALHFGGGWYTLQTPMYAPNCRYGEAKAAYRIFTEEEEFVSSEADAVAPSYITDYRFHEYEVENYGGFEDRIFQDGWDDSGLSRAIACDAPDTEYLFSDCPADRVGERITPIFLGERDGCSVYDAGKNLSGVPVVVLGKEGRARIVFSEELDETGALDAGHGFNQYYEVQGEPGKECRAEFTWFGFRYFAVEGDAEVRAVEFLHTAVAVSSAFRSDNKMLDWFYRTYVHTQLCNMHAGIPSDCPHIERQGYTGDGQLTCRAVMTLFDAKAFYKKWIGDIIDCQDVLTGHVQYTAPYFTCGGGPGAWGCAIVEVPYQYYKQYGDDEPARMAYRGMKRYFDYLEAHSVNGIVVSDKEGQWCLGDWCAYPSVVLPAGFVNNYYYIRSLMRAIEFAERFGYTEDVSDFERRIEERKKALTAAYFNTWDSNFFGCLQGANAFMIDIGLGDQRTYRNLVDYYENLGHIDTGICGTEVLFRVLFEHGDGELAVKLLTSADREGFGGWYDAGATTLWEYVGDLQHSRSHNHPMFGSPVTNFFDYLLGIGDGGVCGYRSLIIHPFLPSTLGVIEGERQIPAGNVFVRVCREEDRVCICVRIPSGVPAELRYGGETLVLHEGENTFRF